MKKVFLCIACSVFLLGCNMNPSKEARIQKLETEVQQTLDRVSELESSIQTLKSMNEDLAAKVSELEGQ
jgi:outer membrane murein-binding lipoprotein Lpp